MKTSVAHTCTAHLEEEAVEQQPALAHSGGLHKVELTELEILNVSSVTVWLGQAAVLLGSCEYSRDLHTANPS